MTVAAVVLAVRGGGPLSRALGSVTWAAERIVLDPAGGIPPSELPPGVRVAPADGSLAAIVRSPWILLLDEHEVVAPALAAEIEEATRGSSSAAYRLPLELRTLGRRLQGRRAPVRLARRGAEVALGSGLALELGAAARSAGRLDTALIADRCDSLGQTMKEIDADAVGLAVLLDRGGIAPRPHRLLAASLAAGARAFCARAPEPLGWTRWVVSVLASYRVVVAFAKLWELRRARVSVPW